MTYTAQRKAERAAMALQVVDLASEHGLAAWHQPEQNGTRLTSVDLQGPHGLQVTVRFQGYPGGTARDTYVLSWHGVEDGWRLDPRAFQTVNKFHGRKATDVAHGFDTLYVLLDRRFRRISDGTAFITEQEIRP